MEGDTKQPFKTVSDDIDDKLSSMRCNNCLRCNVVENCKQCLACQAGKVCEKRRCLQQKRLYAEKLEAERKAEEKARKSSSSSSLLTSTSQITLNGTEENDKRKRGRKKGSTNNKPKIEKEVEEVINASRPTRGAIADIKRKRVGVEIREPRQCLNPDCIHEASRESKYCSEDCGKLLARMRLVEVLPSRMKQYFESTSREEQEEQQRRKLAQEMIEMSRSEKSLIKLVDKLYIYLEKFIDKAHEPETKEGEDHLYEACPVCGVDIVFRKFLKHMEVCWARSEKAITFAAAEKNNDTVYCEKYDQKNKTYCKRLKSLCPEHRKPGPDQFLKVCGYPKKWEQMRYVSIARLIALEEPYGVEGCLTKKEACTKHTKWVQIYRGTIELEQAALLHKMYEMCHEKQKLQNHKQWSSNMLNVMVFKPTTIHCDMPSTSGTLVEPKPEVLSRPGSPTDLHRSYESLMKCEPLPVNHSTENTQPTEKKMISQFTDEASEST